MKRDKKGHLYSLYADKQDAMKVGFAVDVYSRTASLQSGNPEKLQLLGVVPILSEAEPVFHEIMRPHRIVREWYPNDTLMFAVHCELIEHWGDMVEEKAGWDSWPVTGDEWKNPAGVYINAAEMRRTLRRILREFFEPDPDDDWPNAETPTNHWVVTVPKPKVRRVRASSTAVHGDEICA